MARNGKLSTDPYKGVRDFYPKEQALQQHLFSIMRQVAQSAGYEEYSASLLEPAELYRAKGSENEEIATQQTYTFLDRGDREVTLRPEMTPTVARMVAARRRDLSFPLRWYSIPNVFRYERPQRGRVREHWQLNIDLFGSEHIAADAEIILLAHTLMRAFGATENDFEIRISSRGFLNGLITQHSLSEESTKKLHGLLDRHGKVSSQEEEASLKEIGISPQEFVASVAPKDVVELLTTLKELGCSNARFEPYIVRGFDYYTGLVFEVYDTHPDNNRSLFGGGRYDNLMELFGEETMPAVGFGMGDVTIRDFLEVRSLTPSYTSPIKVYLAVTGEDMVTEAMKIASRLRAQGISAAVDLGDKKLGEQIKSADKKGIPHLIVIGRNEIDSGMVAIRTLATGEEEKIALTSLPSFLKSF
ncbi:MAG: histidine--tRNA ligase [Patescibacteria group bacterium]|nr:histidine--tRNA ligase [Patescibacteria group bacterium]